MEEEMGYRYMKIEVLKSIFRRWHTGHTITAIKAAEGFDRKTIRNYINHFKASGYEPGCPIQDEQKLLNQLQSMLPLNARSRSIRKQYLQHKDEIINLITRKEEPVKPKTAFMIVKAKYDLPGSYETFKLFIREHVCEIKANTIPLRIELPPGKEIQLDYGRVGKIYDPFEKRNRIVWAFCARLSCSRLPYIEFVYTQKQESFVKSNINMLEFYGGVSEFLTIDNLKAGVIKPSLYEPELNRAYAEFAEHYGTFINPCIVRKPEHKGKVERLVPLARELFRRLKEIHPTYTLKELNDAAQLWCRKEYGKKKHGTTGIPPLTLFEEEEKAALKPLPKERFETPMWKVVKVSYDRFFVFEGKYYAMPYKYRGNKLFARKTGVLLRIFDKNYSLIREYIVTARKKNWLPGDFPEDKEAMMQGSYPQWLMARARSFGPGAAKLVRSVLVNHAYLNARRARGILTILEKHRSHPFLNDICNKACKNHIHTPKQIAAMLEEEKSQNHFDFIIPTSNSGKAMIRDVSEYFN